MMSLKKMMKRYTPPIKTGISQMRTKNDIKD
jgi:hypothetical protein